MIEPKAFIRLLKHPSYSLFFSCYPMGATTILSASVNVVYYHYGVGGQVFICFLWILWWINVAISSTCFWGGAYLM